VLVTTDPVRARVEIWKHLDGYLELVPGPDRHVELRGRVKQNSLLVGQEAVGRFSPGFGCGGWTCRMLHDADYVLDRPCATLTCGHHSSIRTSSGT
jgi:hypothetical protein